MSTIQQRLDNIINNKIDNENSLKSIDNKEIFIYGAGNIGKSFYKSIKDKNIKVLGFIDRNNKLPRKILDLDVFIPESSKLNNLKSTADIIIAGIFDLHNLDSIKTNLFKLGYKNIYSIHEIDIDKYADEKFYKQINRRNDDNEIIKIDRDKIIKAYDLLIDEEDKMFFLDYVEACVTRNFSKISNPLPKDLQYLAYDIDIKKNYECFVDCGAYDGDTIQNLMDKEQNIKNVIAFEPQEDLFNKLQLKINKIESIEKAILFPCGVHSKVNVYKFKTHEESVSCSSIDDEGDTMIQCISIDQSLKGFNPTFIKMDIEGSEIEALKGAKKTIKQHRPQLAICIYHSLSDLWNIILLINEIDPTYRFYLRNYNYLGFETVLYAF